MKATEFRILGPLEVVQGGRAVTLPGAKQRALLATLLIHANEVVPVDRLIDELWGASPPDSAANAIQVYVSALRKCIEPDRGPRESPSVLVTRKPGYMVVAGPDTLDLLRFERLCAAGNTALAAGDAATAATAFAEALALWKGPALAEFTYEPFAEREATRLEELRLTAVEGRIDAELALGRHTVLVAELEALVAAHPLRERLWSRLMLALYRSGRQAEALRAYQALRTTLAEELGIEPSSDIAALEAAILRQDQSLAASGSSAPGSSAPAGTPTGVVTFLLTDIEGSTALWEADRQAMAIALERHDALTADAVAAAGGVLLKAKGEGDATFSVFRRASDALTAALALRAGLDAERWPGATPVRVRMAIHTGEAYERDGDYFGPAVNRAARLRALAAGGETLCSRATAELVVDQLPDDVALIGRGTQALRDITRPEEVFAVVRVGEGLEADAPPTDIATPRPALPSPLVPAEDDFFIGRSEEVNRLQGALDDARRHQRRLVLVGGEPGVGKTRLVTHVANSAYGSGAVVLYGRCDEGLAVPYQPFVEAFGRYFEALTPQMARAQAGERIGELTRLLPELSRRVLGLPAPTRSDPETERYVLFEAVVDLLSGMASDAPVVLVLDDLHWASEPTLLLLGHLLHRRDLAVVVLATYRETELNRGDPLTAMLAELRRVPGIDRLTLSGLDAAGVLAFVRAAAGDDVDDRVDMLAEAIWRETQGNPFFVGEVLANLVESGAVYQDDSGRWTAAPEVTPDDLGLPEGVRDVVTRRLARLSDTAEKVLTIASVIGPAFPVSLVERVVDIDPDDLLAALEEAARAGLLQEAGAGYTFAHALIRQTLYEELSSPRRMRLHRRVGEALEHVAEREPTLEALAYHFAEAALDGQLTKAADYALAAGRKAVDRSAYELAVATLGRGLEVLDLDDGTSGDLRARRCDLLIALGMAQAAAGIGAFRTTLHEAAQLAEATGDADRLVQAALANQRGGRSVAGVVDADRVGDLEAALEVVGAEDSADRAVLLACLAAETVYADDWKQRVGHSDEALAIARRLDDPATLATVLNLRFEAIHVPSNRDERLADSAAYLELAERVDDAIQIGFAATRRVRVCWETGDVAEVVRCQALMAPVLSVHSYLRYAHAVDEATLATVAGRLDDAEEQVNQALGIGVETDQPDAMPVMAVQLVSLRWEQGRLGELIPVLELAVAENPGIPGFRGVLSAALVDAGQPEDARTLVEQNAANNFADIPYNGHWLASMAMFSHTAVRVGDEHAAAVLYDALAPWHDHVVYTGVSIFGGVADHFLGELAAFTGRPDHAARHFDAAQALYERMGAPTFLARTQRSRAEFLK